MSLSRIYAVTVLVALAMGCQNMCQPKQKSLYDRLGGEGAIRAVVSDAVDRMLANPAVNMTRKGTAHEWQATPQNVAEMKEGLAQFTIQATGGPKRYKGEPMKPLHKGMKISSAEFDASLEDLRKSLQKFNVPQQEQQELLAVVESTRKDIVEVGK